jgi:hypothetical protein
MELALFAQENKKMWRFMLLTGIWVCVSLFQAHADMVIVDKANIALFNSAIFTHGNAVYIAFVQPDSSDGKGYQTVVGKFSEGVWKFSVVEPNSRRDPYHRQPSIVVDSDGYVHVTYNMHSSPWQYSVSASPEDISRWEFRGQELRGPHDDERSSYVPGAGTADIPGNRITYQFITVDRNGTPYVIYREALKTDPGTDYFEMQWSLGIARYDVKSRTWQRVGPDGGVFPFATEPGFRAQGGHIHFDAHNRMHVSWTWYAEYERDGSGHTKPNYPSYAYSDDGGITFNKADGTPLTLPICFADSDIVIHPSWLEPNTEGYFYGYTQVCAMPDGTPYVWVMPKDGPPGTGRAIIRYDASTGWSNPMLMPWGATKFLIDSGGVITAVSSGIRVHRSYDGGQTWKTWEVDTGEGSFSIWLDHSHAPRTDQLRFLAQRNANGELRVYTVNFFDDDTHDKTIQVQIEPVRRGDG